jgi:serine/threonine protein kinase
LYTELSCCALLRKVLSALAYMHAQVRILLSVFSAAFFIVFGNRVTVHVLQGVCHRDLKPENILFSSSDGGETDGGMKDTLGSWGFHEPVITDFGLAVSSRICVPWHFRLRWFRRMSPATGSYNLCNAQDAPPSLHKTHRAISATSVCRVWF